MSSDLTLYFLGASRAIRVAWQLEELELPYNLVASPRSPAGVGPQEFKDQIPAPLKKSPTIKDGDVVVQESGAIIEYLEEHYDKSNKLFPKDRAQRAKVLEWVHAAEGTFAIHGLSILYARWKLPEAAKEFLPEMEKGMSANIINDFNWIESALKEQKSKGHEYLVGDSLTIADIMVQFSVDPSDKEAGYRAWKLARD